MNGCSLVGHKNRFCGDTQLSVLLDGGCSILFHNETPAHLKINHIMMVSFKKVQFILPMAFLTHMKAVESQQ